MVIGYDAKRAFRNNSGLGNYSRMVIGGMARAGVDCVLATPSAKGGHEHYFESMDGVTVVEPEGLWRTVGSLWRTVQSGRVATRKGVDLFHGLSHELPYGLGRDVRSVVTMHDLIVLRYPEFFKPADRVIHRLKMRHACSVADAVVAISEQTRSDLIELMGVPGEKIHVVYQSCDPVFWDYSRLPIAGRKELIDSCRKKYSLPERYVLCVGTLEERKNQFGVVEAFRHLPEDVALVLVGRPRGDYGRRVLACADGRRVVALTKACFADFPALYGGAMASAYMSVFEGFGIPVLESLCCDTPVVTSNVSSMPEAGGDAALYAAPNDCEAIASHLWHLVHDESLRQDCIEKGRPQRMRFAPEKVTQDMLAVYRSLLDD